MSSTFPRYLDNPLPADAALDLLPAPVAAWFREGFGEPTPIQRLAWPALAREEHVLVSAPTGTGKTLAALVPLLGELFAPPDHSTARWSDCPLRGLYVAPLKALVNDAARTLEQHFDDLLPFVRAPLPRLAVRTGDTSPAERRQQRDHPPDLLLTTPESLAVLLSSPASRNLFANLRWVLIDEVHALVGNKRGADLSLSLERLAALATSEVRRIGLSATATPLDTAARWLAGARRPCTIVRAVDTVAPVLTLEPLPAESRFLTAFVDRLTEELPRHRAILVFCNTRALAERLSWALRRRLPDWEGTIAVHHSALSAERRRDVETRFKKGELRAVVTSTSLELGIDIGNVDLAVLVHPPGDVIRLLQRVGRAGHEPGGIRRGLLLTANASELLEAAVTCASGRAGQCEPLTVTTGPLDVLCQQLLGICCARPTSPEELRAIVERAAPYADLARKDFDDCLDYLRGQDRNHEAWLPARLSEDGDCLRVCNARTARLLRRNLGTILTEQSIPVVRRILEAGDVETTLPIGEVDEAFADRLQPGDRFLLDGRCLEFRHREEGVALVEEVPGRPRVPQWIGSAWPLSGQLARRLYLFRLQAAEALREGPGALARLLGNDYGLAGSAAALLADYFEEQETVSEIPDSQTLLLECVACDGAAEYYVHTPLARPANDALARVVVARLAREVGRSASTIVADLGFVLRLRQPLPDPAETMRRMLGVEGFRAILDATLLESEALRTRFSRVAQTGLMVLRNPAGRKRKVGGSTWVERRLFDQVRAHDGEFVLLRQALRELREESCDGPGGEAFAAQLPLLTIRCRWLSAPSPFARAWSQSEPGDADQARTAAEALERLHAELMGGVDAGR